MVIFHSYLSLPEGTSQTFSNHGLFLDSFESENIWENAKLERGWQNLNRLYAAHPSEVATLAFVFQDANRSIGSDLIIPVLSLGTCRAIRPDHWGLPTTVRPPCCQQCGRPNCGLLLPQTMEKNRRETRNRLTKVEDLSAKRGSKMDIINEHV